jgi:ABC-type multidrug transport system permease subunit
MMYGLLVSTYADDERMAMQIGLGAFFPALLLSGVIWPLEGIPVPLVYISYCLPSTWTAEAMRSVFSRGWGLEHSAVYYAFLFSAGYVLFFYFLSAKGLRART